MYGWIHSCLENLILNKYGNEMWQKIKAEAQCDEKIGDFLRYEDYSEEQTFDLFTAAYKHTNLEKDELLEKFGNTWIHSIILFQLNKACIYFYISLFSIYRNKFHEVHERTRILGYANIAWY